LEWVQIREAAAKSNQALRQLAPDIQWNESFVTADKTFCVYLAKDEAVIRGTRNSVDFRPPRSRRSVRRLIPRLRNNGEVDISWKRKRILESGRVGRESDG